MDFFKDKVIIYPNIVTWNYMTQTPHQILKEFAKRGVECIFCDYNQSKSFPFLKQVESNLLVCHDIERLKTHLQDKEVIFYNTHPDKFHLFTDFNTKLRIFHYLDDFPEWQANLDNACKCSDLILCIADKLYNNLSPRYPDKTYKFYNGSAFDLFFPASKKMVKPPDFPAGNPVVYYQGCVTHLWFDEPLVIDLIKSMPKYNFVFCGQRLKRASNFKNYYYFGHKPIEELPNYVANSAVCIIPFKINQITDSTDPIKIYEYFAAGKPVVTSPMPEMKKFGDCVYAANDTEDFKEKIKLAAKEKSKDIREKRIQIARENSWSKRVDTLIELVKKHKRERINIYTDPLISVILPVYNQEQYIEASIDSVLNQTYKNIELIVVNDGSADGTEEVLKKYYNNPKVTIINHNNRKLPGALNSGFRQARGEFLTWTSSDNICLPEQYEKLLRYLQNNPDKGIVYSDYYLIDKDGNKLLDTDFRIWNRTDKKDKSIVRLPGEVTEENFIKTEDNFIGASFLYRREVAEKVGIYCEKYFGAEDLDYWLRMRRVTEFGHLSDLLYLYRVHPDSLNSRHKELGIIKTNKIVRAEDKKRESDKINVAFQLEHFGTGGMEQTTNNIICGLDKYKFNVTLIVTGDKAGNVPPDIKKNNIKIHIIKNNLNALEQLIKEKNFHIVNPHHSTFGFDLYKKYGVKILYTIHNIYSWADPSPEFAKVDKYISVSNACKEYFSPRFNVCSGKIITIPNGLDVKNIQAKKIPRMSLGLKDRDYVFINVGSITKVKMQRWQVMAMAELIKEYPQFKLFFVGSILEDIYYKELKKLIKIHKLQDNIRFFENQTRAQVAGLLQAADCFLLPSLIEGWSNAVMEAMYYEKPLILTDVGNAKDVIENGDIGVIVKNPWGDIKSLTPQIHYQYCHNGIKPDTFYLKNAMVYVYNNREYFKKQGVLGLKKIKEKYLVNHMIAEYEREFKNAIH